MSKLSALIDEIRQCSVCEQHLPLGPRPILRAEKTARIMVIGQAPSSRVHNTGIPWNDPSGKRLRQWMNVSDELFYDASKIAIVPMGFCYPGTGKSGDLPPRPECAPLWHAKLFAELPDLQLTLLIGQYAQRYYLKNKMESTLTKTVQNHHQYGPEILPLPHPSPRNQAWLKNNPWFETEIIPLLQERVVDALR